VDLADLEFDESKYYLGKLCPHGHDWEGTGRSLRSVVGWHCTICKRIALKKFKDNNRMVEIVCDECGSKFKRKEIHFKENVRRKMKVFCSLDCKYKFFRNRVEVVCDKCGVTFEKKKSCLKKHNFCSDSCKFAFYKGSKSHFYIDGRWEDHDLQDLKNKRRQWKWYYWKGVIELIEKKEAPDRIVLMAMEIVDKGIQLQLELNELRRKGKWKEYIIMAIKRLMQAHEDHAIALINGEVRHPQFRLRDIDRTVRTQLEGYREHRKEVVTNAFNFPDETPERIEL